MKIIKGIAIIFLIIILLTPLFLFVGNPVSYGLVFLSTGNYLTREYPELDVKLDKIIYDFKHGGYTAYYSSPTSIDTHFVLVCDGLGQIRYDSIECVYDGSNTFSRIDRDYKNACETALGADFSFEVNFGWGEITYEYGNEVTSINKDFGILHEDIRKLKLDGEYDSREFAAKHGRIYLSVWDPQVTNERAAHILLELKDHFKKENIPFHAIELTLREQGGVGGYVWLVDFLYEDIYEEGLVDRVAASNQATHDHYDRLDAGNF